jgi:hypothetical protein
MHRHKILILFISICIGVSLFFFFSLSQKPPPLSSEQKREGLENILGRKIRAPKDIPAGNIDYKGKYFSLSYPAYASAYDRRQDPNIQNKQITDFLRLDSEEPKFRFVAMVAVQDGLADIGELSHVRTRRQDNLYKETEIMIGSRKGVLFLKDQDGVERSAFFLINGKSASFSITGADPEKIGEIYGKIMSSLKLNL